MRKVLIVVCGICVILTVSFACLGWQSPSDQINEAYYHEINQIIKDIDFFKAKVVDSAIVLYDRDGEQIDQIPFGRYDEKDELIYIRKNGANIYFVRSVAMDDETGVIFVNDTSDQMMDGINSIERIGGNSYYYNTAK